MRGGDALVIDVGPILQAGGEPLATILAAAETVPEGGSLVVLAPFEPAPLYSVMQQMGFAHENTLEGSGFRVVFTRR
ncbi:MAG TPA: DUF2249 domain-containing protein [Thermoanaerobaculia bacterium]|nr:DUF2249 domain-containing protein [Thermoanaerobaculia bacterium]